MGYHTIKTALERVDDMDQDIGKFVDDFTRKTAAEIQNQLANRNAMLNAGAQAMNAPLGSGLIGMGQALNYREDSFRGKKITLLGGFNGVEYSIGSLGEPRAGLIPVHRENGYSFFEDSCVCKDGKMFFYDGNVYDARIPEAPPVRTQAPPEFTKLTEDDDMKEDHNEVLLDEITTRFRKSNRLMGWAGVVIAFLALMAATESKWMPLLASVPWFKRAPAQIEGGSIVLHDEMLQNARAYNAAVNGGFHDYAVSFDKQGWMTQSNNIFQAGMLSYAGHIRTEVGRLEAMQGWSNRIYALGFEKAATASNCTIFFVPHGLTELWELKLETENGEYHERHLGPAKINVNGGTALKTP